MLEKDEIQKLYDEASKVRLNSYSPYSKFKVGAAILLNDGNIIVGTNVENASYGLANCAERSALFNLITKGYKKNAEYSKAYRLGYTKNDIKAMLIIADTDAPCSPCGACRQVISELMNGDADIILTNLRNDIKELKVKDLLPFSFTKEDLNV